MQKLNNSLVSIIIPVYNRERWVSDTLDNILMNNYRPLELILVDDGSSDNSLDVLKNFSNKNREDKNLIIKVLTQTNKGAPAARNLGHNNSSGQYIQFLDSDDLIDIEKFSIQINIMKEKDADFGLCDFTMQYVETGEQVYHSNVRKLNKVLSSHGSFGCGSPLLSRELSGQIFWDTSLSRKQDVDYFLKAALKAKKIAYVNKSLYTYIRRAEDGDRISASYEKGDPLFKERIISLKKTRVPSRNKLFKIFAIGNLFFDIIKLKIKKIL